MKLLPYLLSSLLLSPLMADEAKPNLDDPAKLEKTLAEESKTVNEAQGGYMGVLEGRKVAGEVSALKDAMFNLVIYPGGLPGNGWDGDKKKLIKGKGRLIPVDQRRESRGLLHTITFEFDNGMQGGFYMRQANEGHQDNDTKRYPNRVILIEGKGGKDLGLLVSPQEKEFLKKLMDEALER